MKLWIDDVRPAPQGYTWVKSVEQAKSVLRAALYWGTIEVIDLDHDAGDYKEDGGDYIEILNWLEYLYYTFNKIYNNWDKLTFHIHSMNPVGVENMRRIISRHHWNEI